MKKGFLLLVSITILLSSCSNDSVPPSSDYELRINAQIGNQTRSENEKLQWKEDDVLGVFVCDGSIDQPYLNNPDRYTDVPFRHNGEGFVASDIYLDENEAQIWAYYPYSASATNGMAISIESTTQTDYLYGHSDAAASISSKNVDIAMKHALAQVVFKVKSSTDYTEGPGVLSSLKVKNLSGNLFYTAGTLNASDGSIIGTSNNGVLTLMPGSTVTLIATDYKQISSICLPLTAAAENSVGVIFTIDSRDFKFAFPAGTTWSAGTRNIYTLTLTNSGLQIGGGEDGSDDGITILPWGDSTSNDISLVPIL